MATNGQPGDVSRRIADLSPEKRALLARRMKEQKQGAARQPLIPRRGETSVIPLSFAQQRLWFIDQLEPNNPAYHLPIAVRLSGPLDLASLRHSLGAIVARHEILRTTFAVTDGQPEQVIGPVGAVHDGRAVYEPPLPIVDLGGLPAAEREGQALWLTREESRRPFDLARGPLLRATLLRLAARDHILLLTMHHIIADGWSLGVLIRELTTVYAAFCHGRPSPLPELPVQYADYALWQRERLQEAVVEEQLAYWRAQLADLPVLELPTDRPRPPAPTYAGARHDFALPKPLCHELAALSRREGATLFMTMLAAFQVLLARYSGQEDLAVGTPIAGRTQAETEPLIGCFINTLVLRAGVRDTVSFTELLGQVRAVCLDAYAHQELPFEQIVEALQPDRDLSRHPLFQVMFMLEHAPEPAGELPGLALRLLDVEHRTTHFDLSLSLSEAGGGIVGTLEYSTDLFDAATIGRMIGHFETLLAAIAVDHALPVSALPLLTEAERQQLQSWNATTVAYPPDLLLHQLVAAQVARTPDAIALAFEDQQLTYAALDARANQLARHLQSLGVGPDALVAVALERSLNLVVALLGVLKAGGAYLPLDPSYPKERLAFMLSDSQAAVLLTTQEQRTKNKEQKAENQYPHDHLGATERKGVLHTPPADDGSAHNTTPPTHTPPANDGSAHSTTPQPTVVDLLADWEHIARQPTTPPSSTATAAHLAYAIYTSGSTGQPKGALNAHQAIVNRLLWMQETYGLTASDHVLQKTPFSFDVSVWEFFWPLLAGARLVLARPEGHRDPTYLAELIEQTQITTLHFVPSMLRAFLEGAELGGCTSLRYVICSGEALSAELEARFFAKLGAELHNLYGPTEAAVDVSAWACHPEADATSVPIGRPIANTQLHILDRQMRVVPIGVTGELYIGGVQLARGYHHRPELTAERFVPCPLSVVSSQLQWTTDPSTSLRASNGQRTTDNRLYRTGDLCRYRSDGAIEYLGRIDHQVKLRGFRIELGEIEAVLRGHAAVREAAVVAHEDVLGEKRLVAYLVTDQEQRTKNKEQTSEESHSQFSILNSQFSELRDYLNTRLPDYMIPAAFVTLEALPLTPSGKLDRRALPKPGHEPAEGAGAGEAPRTPAEEVLAGIWSEVLHLGQVGARDNFFTLGGHSLLATQVLSRIRATFGVELALRDLFELPVLADLATRIEGARREAHGLRVPPPQPVGRDRPLPLSFAQQRLWFLDQLEPNSSLYNVPEAVRLAGPLDIARLRWSLGEIARRHEILRTTIATVDGQPVQVIGPAGAVPLPTIDLQSLPDDERESVARRLVAAEAERPFDLARGPLFRVTLLRLGPRDHLALVTMHHIVCDGWTMSIFIRELTVLYAAGQGAAPLPPLVIQYADYAAWQRAWMQGEVLERHLAYWRARLADLPMLRLPTDRPRPAVASFAGAVHEVALPGALRERLVALGRQNGCTLFMTLLAAFQALLGWYARQDDIVVGTDVANRNWPETEPLIGFFVNQLVLRADLSGNPSFRALLGQVREVCLGAYAHQELPFDRLVEALNPARDLSRTPLFQVKFVLQNAPAAALEAPDLTVSATDSEHRTAKFDLLLNMMETRDTIIGALEYSTDLFEAASIARLAHLYQVLLEAITTQPDAPIGTLFEALAEADRLRRAEREQAIVQANQQNLKRIKRKAVNQLP